MTRACRTTVLCTATVFAAVLFVFPDASAASLVERLAGRILLQVEEHGEAWYVHPTEQNRYFLGRPADAFRVMREQGLGITNANLLKIPRAEDKGEGDKKFRARFAGRILLQVEEHGEAWYVHPTEQKRYFLGRPVDAFQIMRKLGLGIANTSLTDIAVAPRSTSVPVAPPTPPAPSPSQPAVSSPAPVASNPSPAAPSSPTPAPTPTPTPTPTPSPGSPLAEPSVSPTQPTSTETPAPAPTPAPTPAPAPTPTPTPTPTQPSSSYRVEMQGSVNNARRGVGKMELPLHEKINTAAQRLADDMITRQYFATKTPEGLTVKELMTEAGYEPRASGVLIAEGPEDAITTFGLWNASESSREIIVKSQYEEMGVAFAMDVSGARPRRVWVLFFASSQVRFEENLRASLADTAAWRNAMVTRLNTERAAAGRAPLVLHDLLHTTGTAYAEDMLKRNFFDHVDPDGTTPHQRITAAGYPARVSAENLAKGPTTVDEVMTGWMNSPGHRANILLEDVDEVGFGLAMGRNASGFNIYWVQHFGKR